MGNAKHPHPNVRRHRGGAAYQRVKAEVHALYGYTCIHCGHDGATADDHVVPLALDPDQPLLAVGRRPTHDSNALCPTCGKACNQLRGIGPIVQILDTSESW